MKITKIYIILLFLVTNLIFSQEFSVSKTYILNNEKEWQQQDDSTMLLKRVTVYENYGIGFVFSDGQTSFFDFDLWSKLDNLYYFLHPSKTMFSIEFENKISKIKNVFITIDLKINDDKLGEVSRKTEFKFDVK